jgi:hypothetical protein
LGGVLNMIEKKHHNCKGYHNGNIYAAISDAYHNNLKEQII